MNIEEHNTPVVENAIIETLKELMDLNDPGTADAARLRSLVSYFLDRGNTMLLKYHSTDIKDILPNQSSFTGTQLNNESAKAGRSEDAVDNEMVRSLRKKKIYRLTYYRKAYEGLKDTEIHKGWIDLLTEIYDEDKALNEIFLRLVEEQKKATITSAKTLQEKTGITRLGYDKSNEKEEARRQMEHVFTSAMRYRYETTLEEMLVRGEKYSHLAESEPAKFHLPDSDKEDSIEEAIYNFFELGDTSAGKKDIEEIAKSIGAPAEVVLRSTQRHTL